MHRQARETAVRTFCEPAGWRPSGPSEWRQPWTSIGCCLTCHGSALDNSSSVDHGEQLHPMQRWYSRLWAVAVGLATPAWDADWLRPQAAKSNRSTSVASGPRARLGVLCGARRSSPTSASTVPPPAAPSFRAGARRVSFQIERGVPLNSSYAFIRT